MLIEQIKKDQLAARKSGNKVESSLLTTLVGESEKIGKDKGNRAPTDDEVQTVVKKFMKGVEENIRLTGKQEFLQEKEILNRYLPKMLSEEQLDEIVKDLAESLQNKGKVMAALASNYKNMYDGKQAMSIVSKYL